MPQPQVGRLHVEHPQNAAKPELRVVLSGERLVEALPHVLGLVHVDAGQHHRALLLSRHGLQEQRRRPARAGGARDDHRIGGRRLGPCRDQPLHRHALPRLPVGGGVRAEPDVDDVEELQRAGPMP